MSSNSTGEEKRETLAERMKSYEELPLEHKDGDYILPCDGRPLVARIDGHNFSQFTRGFEKPFDVRISKAMVETAKDMLKKFDACTAYTQSDEISLVFAPKTVADGEGWRNWPHNGRLLKLSTLLSSFASARFNYHLSNALKQFGVGTLKDSVIERIARQEAHFDARVFSVPNLVEAYNNLYWRQSYDCARNSIHGLAMVHFTHKQLQGKDRREMNQMLLKKDVDYEKTPDAFKYGTFVKKRAFYVDAIDEKTKKKTQVLRKNVVSFSSKTFTVDMLAAKYLLSEEKDGDGKTEKGGEKDVKGEGEGEDAEK